MIPIYVDGGTPTHRVGLELWVHSVPRVGELIVIGDGNEHEVKCVFHTICSDDTVRIQVRVK